MKRLVSLFALALVFAASGLLSASAAEQVRPLTSGAGKAIPDQYIVVLKAGQSAQAAAAAEGITPRLVYSAALDGFAATLTPAQVERLRRSPRVEYIEPDLEVTTYTTQSPAPWHLDRIDQRLLPLSNSYTYYANGLAYTNVQVHAYIIDTGLDNTHPEFEGRANNVFDVYGGTGYDCNGHGTYVGGIVGSKTYGVAKKVKLHGVRALDCNGAGSTSNIIASVDWVRVNAVRPAVANMSIGGGFSSALNTAVTNLANSGVFVSVSAGGSASDACNFSPSSATNVMTVASSSSTDTVASSSSFGPCVDLYAPGVSVTSLRPGGTTQTLSGTSGAAAHAAGVAALYKSTYGDTATASLISWITGCATPKRLTGVPANTPNLLINTCGL